MKSVWISSDEQDVEKLADIMEQKAEEAGIVFLEPRQYDGPHRNLKMRSRAIPVLRARDVAKLFKEGFTNTICVRNVKEGIFTQHTRQEDGSIKTEVLPLRKSPL
jgi:hypothetical protein